MLLRTCSIFIIPMILHALLIQWQYYWQMQYKYIRSPIKYVFTKNSPNTIIYVCQGPVVIMAIGECYCVQVPYFHNYLYTAKSKRVVDLMTRQYLPLQHNTIYSPDIWIFLDHHQRRWPKINPILGQRSVLVGSQLPNIYSHFQSTSTCKKIFAEIIAEIFLYKPR